MGNISKLDTTLTIGMPVFERAWCLNLWFDCLGAQQLVDKKNISLCFAYSRSFDGTEDILLRRGSEYGQLLIYEFDLPTYPDRLDTGRFTTLAQLRNGLLGMVRETGSEYFLSWDNDILFEPDTLRRMFEVAGKDRSVGALMDMGGQDGAMLHPSVMEFPAATGEMAWRKPWSEYPHAEPFKCDVIMAVKLMGKEVYENTEYRWDAVGEDIGWCWSCEEQGYDRWLHPLVRGYHLYDKPSAIKIMQQYPDLRYPEILDPLSQWYWPSIA